MECVRMKLFNKNVAILEDEETVSVSLSYGSGTTWENSVQTCKMRVHMRGKEADELKVGKEYNIGIVEVG